MMDFSLLNLDFASEMVMLAFKLWHQDIRNNDS
jgi:hypothetical protein